MKHIAFDVNVAQNLVDVCERRAQLMRDQGVPRRDKADEALTEFTGTYAQLFKEACTVENEDRVGLARALNEVADQVKEVIASAKREEEQREMEFQARKLGDELRRTDPFLTPGFPEPIFDSIYPPHVWVDYSPRERTRVVGTHSTEGTVSANPSTLRNFVSDARSANMAIEYHLREVSRAWVSYVSACAWADPGGLTLMTGGLRYVEENRLDENWIERIAQAFEDAGTNGPLTEVQITVGVVKHDHAQVRRLLADPTLTPEQLKAVTEQLVKDPAMANVVAEYTTAQVKSLTINSDAEQIKRVTALLEGTATSAPASAALLQKLEAKGLVDRVGLSGGLIERGHRDEGKAYAEALRGVFRTGEPHLASIDPKLSEDYAAALVDNVATEEKRGPTGGNDVFALSFLLHDSRLSKPFLLSMGAAFERTEQHYEDGSGGWRRPEIVSDGMVSLFPPEKIPAIHDPGAFYMSALATNPEAAHTFFAGDQNLPRVRYWLQDRQWGHDGFDGVLSAVSAATTQGGYAKTPESAKLVSSTVVYLTNRGNYSEELSRPYANNDQMLPGAFGKKGALSMVQILGPYMPAVEDAIMRNPAYDGGSEVNVEAPLSRSDLPGIKLEHMPLINTEDLTKLTRVIVSSEDGRVAMHDTVEDYQDLRFRVIAQQLYDPDNPHDPEYKEELKKAVNASAQVDAFHIKQIDALDIGNAKSAGGAVESWVGITGDLANKVPFSSLAGLTPAGKGAVVVDFLAEQVINRTEDALVDVATRSEDIELENAREAAATVVAERRNSAVKVFYEEGVITEERINELAVGHGRSPEEVKNWILKGYSPPSDPEMKKVASAAYDSIMRDLGNSELEMIEYEQIYNDQFQQFYPEK
ncbi:MAG: hypothetical protein Q4C87_07025 [Actinomycetaceae bacterium]|nr:hypothetical protein [Actinomycetaceae bacterium]